MKRSGAGKTLSSKLSGRLGQKGAFSPAFKSRIGNVGGRTTVKRLGTTSGSVHSRLGPNGKKKKAALQTVGDRLASLQNSRKPQKRNKLGDKRLQTSRQADSPLSYRMGNGTIVGGLRSDQMILQKKRQLSESPRKANHRKEYPLWESKADALLESSVRREARGAVFTMADNGLTVSVKNRGLRNRKLSHAVLGSRHAIPARERYLFASEPPPEQPIFNSYSDRTQNALYVADPEYDVIYVDEPEYSPEPSARRDREYLSVEPLTFSRKSNPSPPPPQPIRIPSVSKKLKSSKASMPLFTVVNDRPAPKPHFPILDPQVQKEIAQLQGKADAKPSTSMAGPGIKNFRIVPTQTTTRLSERFTQEKTAALF